MPQERGTIADAFEPLPPTLPEVRTPALEPVDDLGEIWTASRTVGENDRLVYQTELNGAALEPILEALNDRRRARGEFELSNPDTWGNLNREHGVAVPSQLPSGGVTSGRQFSPQEEREFIWQQIAAEREQNPDFLPDIPASQAEFYEQVRQDAIAEREAAQMVLARGNAGVMGTLTAFGGGASQIVTDPGTLIATAPTLGLGWTVGAGRFALVGLATREAVLGMATEAMLQPALGRNREFLDTELTTEEALTNVAVAGGISFALPFVGRGVGMGYDWSVGRVFDMMPEGVQQRWAARMTVADMPITEFYAGLSNREAAQFARDVIGEGSLTAPQRAAINSLEAAGEIGETSPYAAGMAGDAEHGLRLGEALREILERNRPLLGDQAAAGGGGLVAPSPVRPGVVSSSVRPLTDVLDRESVKAAIAVPESRGNDRAENALGSSASGRYQFIESTFVSLYRREYGVDDGAARAVWNSDGRFDVEIQERLMDALLDENEAILRGAGIAPSTGNLYLAHFAGGERAVRLLQADPGLPVSQFFNAQEIAQNPTYLGGDRSVGDALATIAGRVGDGPPPRAPGGRAGGDEAEIAALREEARRLGEVAIGETPLAGGGSLPPMRSIRVNAANVAIDAERFQFKSGGDEFGVTDRLRGVEEWNPVYAGRVVVWEDSAGQLFVADGHQRVGLAQRISGETGQQIQLEGIVLREADGVTAADARTWAALKNIAEGTGTATDAAKVIRQVGREVLDHLPPRSALVRDGAALSRLSDEAFGFVYNEVIPADIAAVVGHLVPDNPQAHRSLVELLVKLDPPNRGQAESIVRQAVAAGFETAEQIDLFGSSQVTRSLFLERAKVLERGLAGLRKLKGVFGVAADNADTLEGAGSTIARSQAQQEAARNAQAIEIVSRQAFTKDSAVAEALNRGAERLAAGDKLADVVSEFVATIRKLDLAALERAGADSSGRLAPDGAGRGGDAGTQGDRAAGDTAPGGQPSLIEMEAATERFSDPDGPAMREQADSLEHDFKANLATTPSGRVVLELSEAIEDWGDNGFDLEVGNATLTLRPDGDFLDLSMIESFEPGAGSAAMSRLVDLADRHGVTIDLYAKGFDRVPTDKLVGWYQRYGFEIPGKQKVPTGKALADPDHIGVDMTRAPRRDPPEVDPNIAARQRQELELAAASPQRADVDQDGTIGLDLFDRTDQPGLDLDGMTFRLSDEGDEIAARDVLDELEGDEAAIAAIRGCM